MLKRNFGRGALVMAVALAIVAGCVTPALQARPRKRKKEKNSTVSANDPTAKLFQVLNDSYSGKVSDLYILADVYSDASDPSQQYQRVLKVDYNKDAYFGRLAIHVRSVGKMTAEQLAIYTPQQIYKFGGSDGEVFDKTNPGPFGAETGDVFLSAADNGPLRTSEITDAVTAEYNNLVTQYILPAVQKQQTAQK